jgi:hypothetical protein
MLDAMDFPRSDMRQWSRRGLVRNLLAPFDSTIVGGEMIEELILVNFITGPELRMRMPSLTYLHESAKEPTAGQAYVERYKEMRFHMNWSRHLTPWPEHLQSWTIVSLIFPM